MTNTYCAIILAAGKGTRLLDTTKGIPKQFYEYEGIPLYTQSLITFRKIPFISSIVIVLPEMVDPQEIRNITHYSHEYGIPCYTVTGGETRGESVHNALRSMRNKCDVVIIHDSARPFFSATLVTSLCTYMEQDTSIVGVIPVIPVKDTIKVVDKSHIVKTLKRDSLVQVQTPQCFRYEEYMSAINKNVEYIPQATDDASLLEIAGYTIHTIKGEENNIKITTQEDMKKLDKPPIRKHKTTMGYDVHAYTKEGRPFVLGGIPITTPITIQAHSDGDVVLHAIIDALLALTDKGDIGTCFPDNNKEYEGISSILLLHSVLEILTPYKIAIEHIDITIVAQEPKIQSFIQKIKTNIAYLLRIAECDISVKATTEEKLGFTGKKEGIKAYAILSSTVEQS